MPSHSSASGASRPAIAATSGGLTVSICSSGRSACASATCPISLIWNPYPSASSDSMSFLRCAARSISCVSCCCRACARAAVGIDGLASRIGTDRGGP